MVHAPHQFAVHLEQPGRRLQHLRLTTGHSKQCAQLGDVTRRTSHGETSLGIQQIDQGCLVAIDPARGYCLGPTQHWGQYLCLPEGGKRSVEPAQCPRHQKSFVDH
jgi:hypothetical protein